MLNLRDVNKLAIVGGGTAGWLTSFFMKEIFPRAEVIVIESSAIGTVGVGEGTYRNFKHVLDRFLIDEDEFFRETNASLKLGISYKGWRNDHKDYMHLFHDHILSELSKLRVLNSTNKRST